MIRTCPKCSYIRQATDTAPEWQCPSCQVAYNKVGGEAAAALPHYGRYGAPVAGKAPARFAALKWIFVAIGIGAGIWAAKPMWQARQAPAAVVASAQPAIILYGTDWCGYCNAARAFLARNGIQFADVDIEKSTAGYEGHKNVGGNGVPVFVIGDQVIHGYNEQRMRSLLQPWLKHS